jgi:hypothetical protein
MNGHHLILGKRVDYLTGETIPDTHDERKRQFLAKFLVEKKGYDKEDIHPRRELLVKAGDKRAVIQIDFSIILAESVCMIVRYGPGSLITRYRPAIAASRTLTPYQIPIIVVTNGIEADVIDGRTGRVISKGLESIPSKQSLLARIAQTNNASITRERSEMESRVLYAYEVDGSCPCDDTICRL